MPTTLDLVIETFVDQEAARLGEGDTSETELALGQALGLLTLSVRELRRRPGIVAIDGAPVKQGKAAPAAKHRHDFGSGTVCIVPVPDGKGGQKYCGKQKAANGRKPAAPAPAGEGSSS